MGKLTVFDIRLSQAHGVYIPGQVMEGDVVVELSQDMKMRGLRLHVFGSCEVHWTERQSGGSAKNRRATTRTYAATEVYVDHTVTLFGKEEGASGDNPYLEAGEHIFPFQFQLPPTCPSSFEGCVGHVRYWLHARIDKPWKLDHTTKKVFNVAAVLDLNQQPQAAQKATSKDQKTLCCLCCESGPIAASLHLDHVGFVPGEAIPIQADIANYSNRDIASCAVGLHMITHYHSTTKTRITSTLVTSKSRGAVRAGSRKEWRGSCVTVPVLPPSGLPGCSLIDVKYILQLTIDPAGPSFDLAVPIDIVIGTMPLQSVQEQRSKQPSTNKVLPANITKQKSSIRISAPAQATSARGSSAFCLPECQLRKVNIRDSSDIDASQADPEFTPVYVYYDWGTEAK